MFSTARSSLGQSPPLLTDDLLGAQRKSEKTRVEAREVRVQIASVAGAPDTGSSDAVNLPGVDDGGETQNLRAAGPLTIPSDGRPHFVPLFQFSSDVETSRVLMAELEPRIFLKTVAKNTGRYPVLAGPVELVQDSGPVGRTEILFVAPGAPFELGFGPQDDLRAYRQDRKFEEKIDPLDKWRSVDTLVKIYVSNLTDQPRAITVTERIPVSEVDEVKIEVLDESTKGSPTIDNKGFCTWVISLSAQARTTLQLRWRLRVAPGVKGL